MKSKLKNLCMVLLAFLTFGVGNVAISTPAHAQSMFDGLADIFAPETEVEMQASVNEFVGVYNKVCWPCLIFNKFAENVFTKGRSVSGNAEGPFRRIIGAVSVVFCLVYLGGGLVAGDASDIARRWTVVWKFLIGAALGSIFLSGAFDNVWNWVYSPVMAVPLAVNTEFGGISSNTLSVAGNMISCSVNSVGGAPAGADGIITSMQGVVCGGHRLSGAGMAYGYALMLSTNGFWGTLTNFVCGIALMAVFLWVAITFPLRFIDILIRLTIIGILAPVLVVLAVFKPTRGYVVMAVQNVLYVGCLFAFTGILFNLGASVFSGVLDTAIQGMQGGEDALNTIVNGIILIGGAIVFSAMIKMAPALAKEFSQFGGGAGGVGDAVGGAISGATSVATKGVGAAASMPLSIGKSMYGRSQNAKAIGGQVAKALGKD